MSDANQGRSHDPVIELGTLLDELNDAEANLRGADPEGKAEVKRQIREIHRDIRRNLAILEDLYS